VGLAMAIHVDVTILGAAYVTSEEIFFPEALSAKTATSSLVLP